MTFKFELKTEAIITVSGEIGTIIARAEYDESENQYFLRYRAADGRAVESWWCESAISPAESK